MRAPSYADLAATLAVVIALGGTAYAAGLPKNSVSSKQIKNGSVKGVDLRNGSVKGADIAESTLGVVPRSSDSLALGGRPASSFQPAAVSAAGPFSAGAGLEVVVDGYGSFRLTCSQATVDPDDDEPKVAFSQDLGSGATTMGTITTAPDGGTAGPVRVVRTTGVNTNFTISDDRLAFDLFLVSADGAKRLHYYGAAADDPTTTGCEGVISADVQD